MDYNILLNTKTSDKWKRTGIKRRAGVIVPLFSVYSNRSLCIGEIPDLKKIIQWCRKTKLSILQLLPMNDTGYDFAPFNALSSFALDPMYLSLYKLRNVNISPFKKAIRDLRHNFPSGQERINYGIKKEKINLLWKIFLRSYTNRIPKFENFIKENSYWLKNYALYKVLREQQNNKKWEDWEDGYRYKIDSVMNEFEKKNKEKIKFQYWLQWQLYEQFKLIKKYAGNTNILLAGDIPFLVSRDSADVWSNQNYFNLNRSAGAPPDVYFASGQNWGMPPYNWQEIENDGYSYLKSKLKYAENFYSMFRIDHFIGLFRIWTFNSNPQDEDKGNGYFDPPDENSWESHGRKILDVIINCTGMLPLAEDLGTVPACSGKVLSEYGIPGTDVQRWTKSRDNSVINKYNTGEEAEQFSEYYDFILPEYYRINSVSTISTHDSSILTDWWHSEAETIDEKFFDNFCHSHWLDNWGINALKNSLFIPERTHNGRLFWKESINGVENLLDILGLDYNGAYELIQQFLYTYKERGKYCKYIEADKIYGDELDTDFIYKSLLKINQTASIFSIQLLQEWLCLDESFLSKCGQTSYRINFPGIVDDKNWSSVLPYSLEKLLTLDINKKISEIIEATGRNYN